MANVSTAQRKHISAQKMKAREARRLSFAKNSGPLIPDEVLRKLASLSLPNSEWIYDACLRKAIAEYMAKSV